jgi:hypothetical protein
MRIGTSGLDMFGPIPYLHNPEFSLNTSGNLENPPTFFRLLKNIFKPA